MVHFMEYKTVPSEKSVQETVQHLTQTLQAKGIQVFAVVNHSGEAKKSQLTLADEQLIIFGDPKVGTFLMQENPLIGIELPLKILVYSQEGKTQVAFPNVTMWKAEFGIKKQAPILDKMFQQLSQLASSLSYSPTNR